MINNHRRTNTHIQPQINAWARGLHRAMQANKIGYAIADAVRGPQVFTFRIGLGNARDLSKTNGMSEQLALNMHAESVRVSRHLGYVDVEVALPKTLRRTLPVRALRQRGGTWIAFGQTSTGTPVHVNLAGNRTCHALISGTTGSGKTVTEQLIALTLASGNTPDEARLILIDAKGSVLWRGFQREEHLYHPLISDPREAVAALSWLVAELDRRKTSGRSTPAIYIIIDELKELIDLAGDPVAEAIRRLTALGRELNIHVTIATQYPLADALGSSIAKANLPLRITGRVLSAGDAYVCTGVKNSGAECLQGNGDFLITAGGQSHRVQMAMVSDRELYQLRRTEVVPRLELDGYNIDRVLSVAKADPLEPQHVAVAMVNDRGIKWLRGNLHVGQAKATRIRQFAQSLMKCLRNEGYTLYPIPGAA